MDLRNLYDRLKREPKDYPLFEQIWQVLTFSPSSKHAGEEELVSLACDALDYLQAGGAWRTTSLTGCTELSLDGNTLVVDERDDETFRYHNTFSIQ